MGIESNQDKEFEEFAASGEVEIGDSNAGIEETDDGKKPAAKRGPPKPAPEEGGEDGGEEGGEEGGEDDGEDDGEEGGEDDGEKKKPSAAEQQINRLKREKRELNRQLRELQGGGGSAALAARLEAIETRLTGGNSDDTKTTGKAAPDPSDAEKYPLGHLDDRYIEDKLEWLADQKATKQADSVLQRQREEEQTQAAERMREALLEQVEELGSKGAELYDDFQEEVVETGMRGDWKLSQPTFEAAVEADNGPQILYELSQDKKEAARVAALSPYQQLKFVRERDEEIGSGKKPRTKPKAGEPPKNHSKGASSKTKINPATDNLNDFEKAWAAEEKASK